MLSFNAYSDVHRIILTTLKIQLLLKRLKIKVHQYIGIHLKR
jgi:hypothetical protein